MNLRGEAIQTLKETLAPLWDMAQLPHESFLQARHEALSVLNHLHWQRIGTGQGVRRVFPGTPPRINVQVSSTSGITNRLTARVRSDVFDPNPANNEAVEETWIMLSSATNMTLSIYCGDSGLCLFCDFITKEHPFPSALSLFTSETLVPSLASFYAMKALMQYTESGQGLIRLYKEHSPEMVRLFPLVATDSIVEMEIIQILQPFDGGLVELMSGGGGAATPLFTQSMIDALNRLADRFVELGSPELREAIETERARFNGLQDFVGKNMVEWAQTLGISVPQAPFLSLSSIFQFIDGDLYFEANHLPGHAYSIWYTDTLDSPYWRPVEHAGVDLIGHTVRVLVRDPQHPAEFYRLQAEPILLDQ